MTVHTYASGCILKSHECSVLELPKVKTPRIKGVKSCKFYCYSFWGFFLNHKIINKHLLLILGTKFSTFSYWPAYSSPLPTDACLKSSNTELWQDLLLLPWALLTTRNCMRVSPVVDRLTWHQQANWEGFCSSHTMNNTQKQDLNLHSCDMYFLREPFLQWIEDQYLYSCCLNLNSLFYQWCIHMIFLYLCSWRNQSEL